MWFRENKSEEERAPPRAGSSRRRQKMPNVVKDAAGLWTLPEDAVGNTVRGTRKGTARLWSAVETASVR